MIENSVCLSISILIIIITILYISNIITYIPCGKNVQEIFAGNFVHVDPYHLISNLYALYSLSRVERRIGKNFKWLVVFLTMFNTLIEYYLRKMFPQIKCSIGFSGILFGLMSWELITENEMDLNLILSLIIIVINPSLEKSNISLIGHTVGALSGIVGGLTWKYINKS